MNILEKFWYGNLNPADYDANPSRDYMELTRLVIKNEEKLLVPMTEKQKELFSKYRNCVRVHQIMRDCSLFQNSFRLGGRIMLAVIRHSDSGK